MYSGQVWELSLSKCLQKMNNFKRSSLLSILWVFVTLNYIYCDVVTLMDSAKQKEITSGIGPIHLTPGFLLGASVLIEIPIAMILFSRILNYKAARWTNIIAGIIMTLVQASSLFITTPTSYYIFFSVIEIATTAVIVWYALKWKKETQ